MSFLFRTVPLTTLTMNQPTAGRALAEKLDGEDSLRLRDEFNIPSMTDVARTSLPPANGANGMLTYFLSLSSVTSHADCCFHHPDADDVVYLVGNSLGLQPKRTAHRIQQYLATWSTQGVQGHFKPFDDSPLPIWLDVDARAAELIAPIVGAQTSEVAVMQTLTANLHLLMAAFYKPDPKGRHKILLEGKAFPSDHASLDFQCCKL